MFPAFRRGWWYAWSPMHISRFVPVLPLWVASCLLGACTTAPDPHLVVPAVVSPGEHFAAKAQDSRATWRPVSRYHYDFGDGSGTVITVEPTAVHQYSRIGTFNVTLQVEDVDGRLGSVQRPVRVVLPEERIRAGGDYGRDEEGRRLQCPVGMFEGEDGFCGWFPATAACVVNCTVDVERGTHDCPTPTVRMETLGGGAATATLDLTPFTSLSAVLHVCDPSGITFHVADSPSCNGFGGDSGDFSHSGELHTVDNKVLLLGDDAFYAANGGGGLVQEVQGFLPSTGCSSQDITMNVHGAHSNGAAFTVENDHVLSLNADTDDEGRPDALWFLALNRTYATASRSGQGLRSVSLCFQ